MATGTLILDGKVIENPSGCYNRERQPERQPMTVDNQTDTVAAIYDQENCKGPITGTVQPRARGVFEFGVSLSI